MNEFLRKKKMNKLGRQSGNGSDNAMSYQKTGSIMRAHHPKALIKVKIGLGLEKHLKG